MSVRSLLSRLFRKDGARAEPSRFGAEGVLRDPTHDSLNREESFRVEALEPRILLSADPVMGEMARIADKAGWDDPMSNLAAIVEVIDATENQDAKAAEIAVAEPLEAEMEWPEDWTENAEREVVQHEPLDASADEDPDYGFGSTLVGTSVDLDSISPTGPPAQQGATVEVQSADDAHAPSAFSVSEIHDLTLGGANSGALNAISLKAEAQATFDAAVALWAGANGPVPADLDFVIGDLAAGTHSQGQTRPRARRAQAPALSSSWRRHPRVGRLRFRCCLY